MELIVMILVPFPLGFILSRRIVAYIAYIALHAFVFTFQTLVLILDWVDGSEEAFGPYPHASSSDVWSYGALNLIFYAVGLGLVALGYYARTRLGRRASANLDLR